MIAVAGASDYYNPCWNCTQTCYGSGCSSIGYGTATITISTNWWSYFDEIKKIPPKELWRLWLQEKFPTEFPEPKVKTSIQRSEKRYHVRQMFSKSGRLPRRIREIRCNA